MMGGAPGSDVAVEQESKQRGVIYGPKMQLVKEFSIAQQNSADLFSKVVPEHHKVSHLNEQSYMSEMFHNSTSLNEMTNPSLLHPDNSVSFIMPEV